MPSISGCFAARRLRSPGPGTFDLISARVGKITIDAAPAGRFSVSIGAPASDGTAPATFRLQVNSSSPLILSFTSGQEYDFALNDSAGNTIWRWSAPRTLLQPLHQRTVSDEWSATVDIPWAPAPGDSTVHPSATPSAATPFS